MPGDAQAAPGPFINAFDHRAFPFLARKARQARRGSQTGGRALGASAMTAFKSGDPLTLNRLYGRSSGHRLRKSQQELVDRLLPQIEVPAEGEVTAKRLFGDDRLLHFEIGFGS